MIDHHLEGPGAFDTDAFLAERHYAFEFRDMIGDVEDFLEFSELNIEWQLRRELRIVSPQAAQDGLAADPSYLAHLEDEVKHRFTVSLPLRIRYAALIALVTSVEWSVAPLVALLRTPLAKNKTSPKQNETVFRLHELETRLSLGAGDLIDDFEALVFARNCIAHNGGLLEDYGFSETLPDDLARLNGIGLENRHFLGTHIWIERGALNPYIEALAEHVPAVHRACDEQGLLQAEPKTA